MLKKVFFFGQAAIMEMQSVLLGAGLFFAYISFLFGRNSNLYSLI